MSYKMYMSSASTPFPAVRPWGSDSTSLCLYWQQHNACQSIKSCLTSIWGILPISQTVGKKGERNPYLFLTNQCPWWGICYSHTHLCGQKWITVSPTLGNEVLTYSVLWKFQQSQALHKAAQFLLLRIPNSISRVVHFLFVVILVIVVSKWRLC